MGGPTVNGSEQKHSSRPMAWLAFSAPTKSKAIGPSNDIKHPSKTPKPQQMIKSPKLLDTGMEIVNKPMEQKAICCKTMRLT